MLLFYNTSHRTAHTVPCLIRFLVLFDPHAEGRLVSEAAMRDRVAASGCEPSLRREVWKWLLGMYPRGSTAAQRAALTQVRPPLPRARVPGPGACCAHWEGRRAIWP